MRAPFLLLGLCACGSDRGTLYGGGWLTLTVERGGEVLVERRWKAPDRAAIRGHVRWKRPFVNQAIGFEPRGPSELYVQVWGSEQEERFEAEDLGISCEAEVGNLSVRMGAAHVADHPWLQAEVTLGNGGRIKGLASPLETFEGGPFGGEVGGQLGWETNFRAVDPNLCWAEAGGVPVFATVAWQLDERERARGPAPYVYALPPEWPESWP